MTARWTSRCSSRGLKVLALGLTLVLLGVAALLLFLGGGVPTVGLGSCSQAALA